MILSCPPEVVWQMALVAGSITVAVERMTSDHS